MAKVFTTRAMRFLLIGEGEKMIDAKVIEDSVGEAGVRLTTLQLIYPRFIHAEFMTHRVFSRNASSSRAIPVAKMLEMVRNEPAMPIHWGANQPGMQAKAELTGDELRMAKEFWLNAAEFAATQASLMNKIGLHKQVANRILEPFQHIQVIVTATEWDNFFALRAHPDAQPEIHDLALKMQSAMGCSDPKLLTRDEWHLPYVTEAERNDAFFKQEEHINDLMKISAARCARVSYLKHDGGIPAIADDLALFDRLVGSTPLHASPVEHQAMPDFTIFSTEPDSWDCPNLHGNLRGWIQYRKLIENQFN
jgi:thymidylate synthase ThyX